jgi:ATP-binding protein involved in chromosome partitioning
MATELPNANARKVKPQVQSNPIADNISGIQSIVAVSSGKGGVGKSTISTNLAVSLAQAGYKVGLMDADVYGPSVSKMLGGKGLQPKQENGKLVPIEKYGVRWMSMALLTDEDTPVIWRGPMATRLINQFLGQVAWGELDYLLIDLPPGTGDVQLTLTQSIPLTGAIVVSSPQQVAVEVTMRGMKMFDEVRVPILGMVENMSGFVCPQCNQVTPVFDQGHLENKAKELGIAFLGQIPLDPTITLGGDDGAPVATHEDSLVAQRFTEMAKTLNQIVKKTLTETANNQTSPTQISSDHDHLLLMWKDNSVSEIPFKELRFACPCAQCVSEVTGKRMIEMSDIKDNIEPTGFRPVGKYGLQIHWNDGHNTGIYTFNHLQSLADPKPAL